MSAPEFPGSEKFLFGAPLYSRFKLPHEQAKAFLSDTHRIDGYCVDCGRSSTFFSASSVDKKVWGAVVFGGPRVTERPNERLTLICARDHSHKIIVHVRWVDEMIEKVGQYPSFADIAIEETKQYRSVLKGSDAAEFHKALGLAAHGVGIGAFVYIRRIFERLIRRRFDEFKEQEGWREDDFEKLRMVEKIELMKDHLPAFLVANRRLYSILSLGIHELTEEDCLSFFDVIKTSTLIILEEDKRKKEELALRDTLEQAIARYEKPKEGS